MGTIIFCLKLNQKRIVAMNIVFLDSHVVNPGDLGWGSLERLGPTSIYDSTPSSEIIERSSDAEAILIVRSVINREVMNSLPNLRYIGVFATGFDVVDTAAANEYGITVTNVSSYNHTATAQGTMALLLELANHVGHHSYGVRSGDWSSSQHFCYWDRQIVELSGLTLGLVGFGKIAQRVAKLAYAHDMTLLASTRSGTLKDINIPVRLCKTEELLQQADVVSLHCPLTDETRSLINKQSLALMKPSALLINTARGGLVDEFALAKALCEGQISGAGLDVMAKEPPDKDNPLLTAPNCVITPHNSWSATKTRERLLSYGIANLEAFINERPINVVNHPIENPTRNTKTFPRSEVDGLSAPTCRPQ